MKDFFEISDTVKYRNYEKIFTGTNQEGGYDHPFLEFIADTSLLTLKADNYTYFHYANTTTDNPVVSSGLIEAGAIAGEYPYIADKIYKKNANYKKSFYWGDSTQPQEGTWLCTWLSGNPLDPTQQPIWMDRWYLPGYAVSGVYYNSTSAAVWDEISNLTFNPGGYYKYLHVGNTFNNFIVNNLLSGECVKLNINNWKLTGVDTSEYDNLIQLENIKNTDFTYETLGSVSSTQVSCINLNGIDQYVNIINNSALNVNDVFTFNSWVYIDDCDHIQGNQIIGKGFRGGWCIKSNNGFFTPILFIFGNNGKSITVNNNNILSYKEFPGESDIVDSKIDSDLYVWVLDNGLYDNQKHLYKTDFDGNILSYIEYPSAYNLKFLAINSKNEPTIYESTTQSTSSYDTLLNFVSSSQLQNPSAKQMIFDRNDGLKLVNFEDYYYDDNDNIWALSGGKLIYADGYNQTFSLVKTVSDLDLQHCAMDRYNNIWAVDNTNIIYEIDYNGHITTTFTIGDSSIDNIRRINLTSETYDGYSEDILWITDYNDQKIYKCNTIGAVLEQIYLRNLEFYPNTPTFSNYDWNRLYNYINKNEKSTIQLETYFGTEVSPICGKSIIDFNTEILTNKEWHMFTITYNINTGICKFYIDAYKRGEITVTPGTQIYYNYNNAISFGTNSGRYSTLAKELKNNNLYFSGKIGPTQLISKELTDSDIRFLYLKYYNHKDMLWCVYTQPKSYIEEIEQFFKFKLPGSKSQFFNIRIVGMKDVHQDIKNMIENIIRDTISKLAPIHCELYKIIWE